MFMYDEFIDNLHCVQFVVQRNPRGSRRLAHLCSLDGGSL
jgi:hypothetical protein